MSCTYKDITYSLKKSNRKTASIYIERDGSVSVLVPKTLKKSDVEELIEKKRKWIYRNLAELAGHECSSHSSAVCEW